jgi:hypothetical protein
MMRDAFVRDEADGVERFESQVVSISIFILRGNHR